MSRSDPQAMSGAQTYPVLECSTCTHAEDLHGKDGCTLSCDCKRFIRARKQTRCYVCGAHLHAIEAARLGREAGDG